MLKIGKVYIEGKFQYDSCPDQLRDFIFAWGGASGTRLEAVEFTIEGDTHQYVDPALWFVFPDCSEMGIHFGDMKILYGEQKLRYKIPSMEYIQRILEDPSIDNISLLAQAA